ncbi:MAG: lipase [Planctomycetota bacterium]|nr:MAG: lipase [Planctomycetota bacterium]
MKFNLSFLFLLVLFLANSSLVSKDKVSKAVKGGPTYSNVSYGKEKMQTLNFWKAEGKGPRPVLVQIHGGGWSGGRKISRIKSYQRYLKAGISVASIDYRLTRTHPLPAPVHDAARAIQFIRYKAKEWNVNKNKIAATGGSAGGCTSMWLLLHDDLKNPKSKDPVLRESTRLCAAVVSAAQTSIDPKVISKWLGDMVTKHSMIYTCVGERNIQAALKNYKKHSKLYKEFSPINHLDKNDPPMYLNYAGSVDSPIDTPGHAIHHAIFGQKAKEAADKIGHKTYFPNIDKKSKYKNNHTFMMDMLLSKKK